MQLFPKREVRPSPQPINQLVAENPTWREYLGSDLCISLLVFPPDFAALDKISNIFTFTFNIFFTLFIISLTAEAEPQSANYTESPKYRSTLFQVKFRLLSIQYSTYKYSI